MYHISSVPMKKNVVAITGFVQKQVRDSNSEPSGFEILVSAVSVVYDPTSCINNVLLSSNGSSLEARTKVGFYSLLFINCKAAT